jgi:hypothetical protein
MATANKRREKCVISYTLFPASFGAANDETRPLINEMKKVKCTLVQALRLCTGRTVKCTLVQALRFCTDRTAYRGRRGIALPFHDHGTRRGWVVSVTPLPLFTPWKDPVPIVQEAGWAPGPFWSGAEISPPPGFDPRTIRPVASRYTDYGTRPKLTRYFYGFYSLWTSGVKVPGVLGIFSWGKNTSCRAVNMVCRCSDSQILLIL